MRFVSLFWHKLFNRRQYDGESDLNELKVQFFLYHVDFKNHHVHVYYRPTGILAAHQIEGQVQ